MVLINVSRDSRFCTNNEIFIRFLANFNKSAGLSEDVKICMPAADGFPLCLEYKLVNKSAQPGKLRFFLIELDTGKPDIKTTEEDFEESQMENEVDESWLD